jgi:phthiocerol/phenolphthiocerol synthesis type-I polyketide synthase C
MSSNSVAIIGLSGRFPGGANSPAALWSLLQSGRSGVREVPVDRWNPSVFHPRVDQPGKIPNRHMGWIDEQGRFDPVFFGISTREATRMDPQQRLLMQLAWECIEDAGEMPSRMAGTAVGVYVGISGIDYGRLQFQYPELINAYTNSGAALSIAANRISYALDLSGPSMAVDTACSSSLVALHLARESVLRGESTSALIGGVNIIVSPDASIGFARASMLSPTGRCHAFGAAADGFVRAEGGAMIMIKPLARAIADGNRIIGLLRGTGLNSDGRTAGLSLPSAAAQERLLRDVYDEAKIDPRRVLYVEAHGTGTPAGDPIECKALGRVFGPDRNPASRCLIGSVKANIGHMESASGMAALAKVLLAFRNREIPGMPEFEGPNPAIPFAEWGLEVLVGNRQLPMSGEPAIVGINSFGFGGANAHAILQEYRESGAARWVPEIESGPCILCVSAKSHESLTAMTQKYAVFLREPSEDRLSDICHSAALRRDQLELRFTAWGRTREEIAAKLEARGGTETQNRVKSGGKLAFVFSGNGPQWWGMGRQLMADESTFRQTIQNIDAVFQPLAGWSLREQMVCDESESRMHLTEVAQPALFMLQVALVEWLETKGIYGDLTIGHSVGEVAAAYVAGALTLEQAIRVVIVRSRLQELTAGKGRMAAAGLTPIEAADLIAGFEGRLEIAAINSPSSITLSGDVEAIEQIEARIVTGGKFFRALPLNYSFHSRSMDPLEAAVREELATTVSRDCGGKMISTVTGKPVTAAELDADYWWRNIRQPVRFSAGIERLIEDGVTAFLEIGPHPVLRQYLAQIAAGKNVSVVVIPTLKRGESEIDCLYDSLCLCQSSGLVRKPERIFGKGGRLVSLPSYAWQQEDYWNPPKVATKRPQHALLGPEQDGPDPIWQQTIDPESPAFLADHVVKGNVIFPASAYIEMALAAAETLAKDGSVELVNFDIHQAMVLIQGHSETVQFRLADDRTFSISSKANENEGKWNLRATGRIGGAEQGLRPPRYNLDSLKGRLSGRIKGTELYERAAACGFIYGPSFRRLGDIYIGSDEALGFVQGDDGANVGYRPYLIHPATLDVCFQPLFAALIGLELGETRTFLPVRFESLRVFAPLEGVAYSHVTVTRRSARSIVASYRLLNADGEVLATIDGFRGIAFDYHPYTAAASHVFQQRWFEKPRSGQSARISISPRKLRESIVPLPSQIFHRREFYSKIQKLFDKLCVAYAATALHQLGATGRRITSDALVREGRILETHGKLVNHLLELLAREGLAECSDSWYVLDPKTVPDPLPIWREIASNHASYSTELLLLSKCGENFAELLQGKQDPLDLIFSDTRSKLIEDLYDSAPASAIYNAMLRDAVFELVKSMGETRSIRILEVGAGTGGLTSHLLPVLPADRTEYIFTDVSPVLVGKAKERFKNYPFVRYAVLDINEGGNDAAARDGYFDLVIAANVVHATPVLSETLQVLSTKLAPGGLLLLLEKHDEWMAYMVFGLLKGWWAFTDSELRAKSPLLNNKAWLKLFRANGFDQVTDFSDRAVTNSPQNSVLIARKPLAAKENAFVFAATGKRWLILRNDGDGCSWVTELVQALRAGGDAVLEVRQGKGFQNDSEFVWTADFSDPKSFVELCGRLVNANLVPDEIVHLAGIQGLSADAALSAIGPDAERQDLRCLTTVFLVQALMKISWQVTPRLWLITSGAWTPSVGSAALVDPFQAPIWGLGRVLRNEYPDLRCRMVDLRFGPDQKLTLSKLLIELAQPDDENELLLDDGCRFVHRVERIPLADAVTVGRRRGSDSEDGVFRIGTENLGILESLQLQPAARRTPQGNEVEIEVKAAGLNFHDLMWAMNMLPDEAIEERFGGATLGLECAGIVTSIGKDVTGLKVGDAVVGFGRDAFGSHVVTSEMAVAPKPKYLSFEEAATIGITFFTAVYGLENVAQISPGERVLIHGATGGVGLAAIQVAQERGAIVFATAGTDEKRGYLRKLGVQHVFNSRTLDFASEIMDATQGEGVDVILNSIAGEAIHKNLGLLRPFGRFLEIGKRDFYSNFKIGLRPFANNLSYFGIDADQIMLEKPQLVRGVLVTTMERFRKRIYRSLPHRDFPITRAVEAFRYMQHSRQIGKVVLTIDPTVGPTFARSRRPEKPLRLKFAGDGTYIISGGLEGFGLATAKWMVEKGVRHLALISRRGPATPGAQAILEELRAQGVNVHAFATDVCDGAAVENLIEQLIPAKLPAIRGVIHAAMVLHDGIVAQMTGEQFNRALHPKMLGAWNLHWHTRKIPIDTFVLYSSAMTLAGNPGQSNYAAGNMFLESLAAHRRSQGLPALTVGWGAIGEVGYIARNDHLRGMLKERLGLEAYSPRDALWQLEQLLLGDAVEVTALDIDVATWRKGSSSAKAPFYSLLPEIASGPAREVQTGALRVKLLLISATERLPVLQQRICQAVADITGLATTRIEPQMSPLLLGLDSLMMVELSTRLSRELGMEVPLMQIVQAESLEKIAILLLKMLKLNENTDAPPAFMPSSNGSMHEIDIGQNGKDAQLVHVR